MADHDEKRQCWFALPDPAAAAAARPADHPYNFGFATGMGRLLSTHPRFAQPFMQLFGAIMFAPGHLDRQEREMVAAVAAQAQECFY